jgi:hypothetical protein
MAHSAMTPRDVSVGRRCTTRDAAYPAATGARTVTGTLARSSSMSEDEEDPPSSAADVMARR